MIKNFTYNTSNDIAFLTLTGDNFHEELECIRQIPRFQREFDGEQWKIYHAEYWAHEFKEVWPKFLGLIRTFQQQPRLI